ncbi:MAG: hypothetical protein AB8H79_19045, partial [Myxococcota bacterium]
QSTGVQLIRTSGERITGLSGSGWIDADASVVERDGTDWWAIAGVKSNGTVELAYGPAEALTRLVVPVASETGTVRVTSVAVQANASRVLLGVTGTDPAPRVGWTLFAID